MSPGESLQEVIPMAEEQSELLTGIDRLSADLKKAAITLSHQEARYLVDAYYTMQEARIRAAHQTRTADESGKPHAVIEWLGAQNNALERSVARALDSYTAASVVGQWSRTQLGVGPILAAGLLAHIDITKAPTVGHIWRFAGLDPTTKWEKGQRRPWNAALKLICWKLGESFVKVSGNDESLYGQIWKARKALETERNEAGLYADQARESLTSKRFARETATRKAYEEGKLPLARIHLRAQRYAVKLFLSHWQTVAYRAHYGEMPVKPYALSILGHVHEVQVPHWPF